MTPDDLKSIVEGALFAAGKALSVEQLQALFEEGAAPDTGSLKAVLSALMADYEGRGVQLQQVASGWRFQVRTEVGPWVSRLWEERPQRYSRALLETLALIAYRQPITRSEIEDIRGVTVSTQIVKTLLERDWIRVAGHKEVPGRPALFATTRGFLDDFNLRSLADLPALADIRDLSEIAAELEQVNHE
ncbi:SMC-Scp complex subunit ScpB [Amnimonas aquatica]|uniref:SMC-Scp complex subunit ScpB n=1 Tax=Amnimonas aquatica TaxID=2094561 RepID=A0A2P6AVE2_9GAMM|nr:SMC-Scp complex subunit ScpB [Amnimonas aquatica]PQA52244.1 SMC-Scp complex subunit ScpB [Amnimonas aquatica]